MTYRLEPSIIKWLKIKDDYYVADGYTIKRVKHRRIFVASFDDTVLGTATSIDRTKAICVKHKEMSK